MKRRSLLGLLASVGLGQGQSMRCFPTDSGLMLCQDPANPGEIRPQVDHTAPVIKAEHEFAEAWNAWVKLRDETPTGAYSFPARRQWEKVVEPAWKEVRLAVRNE